MDDELRSLGQLVKSDDELHLGGPKGGTTLRRSELQILRRSFSDRLPFTENDRQSSVRLVMQIINGDESTAKKLTALSVFASMEKRNLEELKLYLAAKLANGESPLPSVVVNNQVVVNNVTAQSVLDEYGDIIAGARVSSKTPAIDDPGKQIHPPEANGKAS